MGDKDFFLSPDDAMTMGDINYMRKAKRTRRTFPKTLKNKDGFALENEVSSMENRNNLYKGSNTNQNTTENTVFNPTPSSQSQPGITGGSAVTQTNQVQPQTGATTNFEQPISQPAPKPVEKRRQSDDGMDMFRNMAKKVRRGK
ncbi:hypothetical protein IQ255_20920 [Pleurocapsales cyanobacterium LEGE 10410]|nr:hypothetical protein [Pleurocapsales cyanobacterium LEGE 10410]